MLSLKIMNKIAYYAIILLTINSCAIHSDQTGKIHLDFDEAVILGNKSRSFRVPNVGEATLRVMNGQYSIKLENRFQVISIGKADRAEINSVLSLGDRSLIIVTKDDGACKNTTQLIAIRGLEALSWDFGDCYNKPEIGKSGDTLIFYFQQNNGEQIRSTYRNGVFINGFGVDSPVLRPQSISIGSPRYRPEPPAPPDPSDQSGANSGANGSPTIIRKQTRKGQGFDKAKAPPSSLPLAKALEFSPKEQKPIRIILDR